MNKRETRKYEKALLAEKQRMLKQGRATDEVMEAAGPDKTGDLSTHRTHSADQGTENYQREMASRFKTIETDTLRQIEDALERVANGTYGVCVSCGGAVPKARLDIVPHARFCMKCLKKRK
ncbi:MAG TPA: TraR/DksA C4-type zinc finger protein [bacterium]|nr:TraR/DksA C4-type zinc finger protein [bacterium]